MSAIKSLLRIELLTEGAKEVDKLLKYMLQSKAALITAKQAPGGKHLVDSSLKIYSR